MATRVVVAEDEWLMAALLRSELERQGFEVVGTAGTGSEAVKLCGEQRPDVVLMDIQMPEMDGLEATRTLMRTSPTCVVIVTGQATLDREAEQAGAMCYALKPLAGGQIPGVIAEALVRFGQFAVVREAAGSPEEAMAAWLTVRRAVGALMREENLTEAAAFGRLQQRVGTTASTLLAAAQAVLPAPRREPQQAPVS